MEFNNRLWKLNTIAAAVIAAGGMLPTAVSAADTVLEEVVVTGTRKEGLSPLETLSPVDLIGGKSLQNQASFDLTDALTKMNPSLSTQRFPIADGTAIVRPVTLRNLAPDQTLVLVNGTRRHRSALVNLQLAPLGTVNQGSQAVDFSAIPSSAIKRVEVLRDGASAQYGSDAIAGVINVILKDADEGFSFSTQHGQYSKGDGDRLSINANAGFALTEKGFVNASLEHSTSDITDRGNARLDAAAIAAIVGYDAVDYHGKGQRWGDPDIEATKLFLNSAFEVNDELELFGNFSYMDNKTLSGFFYRTPVLPGTQNSETAARTTLKIDADDDGIADAASADQVQAITDLGLTVSDYLTPDGSGGYLLLNPIHTLFPGGYSPKFGANISDYALVLGGRGSIDEFLTWDVRARIAENEIEYVLNDSINPSLGQLSPTRFNPGTLTQEESSFNADFVKTFDQSPMNIGFGFEWRNETYIIGQGDAASIAVGPTATIFGVGSDGFQGYFPDTAGEFESDSYAAYVDVETDITDQLSGAVALRYEDYDEFDSTLDWKVSLRYEFTDQLAVRATTNTGFRAPTPGQVNTLNVTTTSDSTGALIPSGTYPVDNPVAIALGAKPLDTEESTSYTLGVVYQMLDNTSLTLDYYNIEIEDRIGLLSKSVGDAQVAALVAAGINNAASLKDSSVNYFANGFDSDISGIDIALTRELTDIAGGDLVIDLRHNHNKHEVDNVKAGTINAGRVFDLENHVPKNNTVLSFDYTADSYGVLLRLNRYDDWETTGGLFGLGDATDTTRYDGATLVDLELKLNLANHYKLTLGSENIFDKKPDKEENGVMRDLGVDRAVTSPFGFNGAFFYLRLAAEF